MKTYTNSEKLTAVLVYWAKPLVDEVVASRLGQSQQVQSASEWVKKYFPVPSNYSIVNDLSFLAVPATEMLLEPIIRNGIAKLGVKDEDIPGYAAKLLSSMMDEADNKGSISLFNTVELEKRDLEKLRKLLERNLSEDVSERYEVIE